MAKANDTEPTQNRNDAADLISMTIEARIVFDAAIAGIEKMIDTGNLPPKLPELTALRRIAEQAGDAITAVCNRLQGKTVSPELAAAVAVDEMLCQCKADMGKACEALDFYANPANYERLKSGADKRPEVVKDAGQRARETLATLADGEADG